MEDVRAAPGPLLQALRETVLTGLTPVEGFSPPAEEPAAEESSESAEPSPTPN